MRAGVALAELTPTAQTVLRAVAAHLQADAPAWLVGGAIRDALLGRAAEDVDLAVPSGGLRLGRALADELGWAFVALDAGRGVCRLVGDVTVDIADFRGPDLASDLRGRDVTVNALAVSVEQLVARGRADIEDATGGVGDLAARRIRLCSPRSLADDPIRAMRAARLAVQPGWHVDRDVAAAARAVAASLRTASAERIRDELIALANGPAAGAGFRRLDEFGVAAAILPESGAMRAARQSAPHCFDVWEHSLRAVEAMDTIAADLGRLAPWGDTLSAHLTEHLGDGLRRAGALKLATLLHDVAKPETRVEVNGQTRFFGHDVLGAERARAIAARWRMAGRATNVVARLVRHHLRPMHLGHSGEITRRARYRFFRDLGDDARDLVLLALADASGVRGDDPFAVWAGPGGGVLRSLMEGTVEAVESAAAPPLLDGHDVMAALGIGPGPAVGRMLAALREDQALGRITTRAEALAKLAAATPRAHPHD
jgi:poly(A) polymerase/tRNA nucleotidyltransferase (CCA-adding enzyme)